MPRVDKRICKLDVNFSGVFSDRNVKAKCWSNAWKSTHPRSSFLLQTNWYHTNIMMSGALASETYVRKWGHVWPDWGLAQHVQTFLSRHELRIESSMQELSHPWNSKANMLFRWARLQRQTDRPHVSFPMQLLRKQFARPYKFSRPYSPYEHRNVLVMCCNTSCIEETWCGCGRCEYICVYIYTCICKYKHICSAWNWGKKESRRRKAGRPGWAPRRVYVSMYVQMCKHIWAVVNCRNVTGLCFPNRSMCGIIHLGSLFL